jgi:hypothetical protein
MDSQIWIYIIIGIIYFVSRFFKKSDQPDDIPDTRSDGQPRRETTERPKQLTFEELLREITEAKQPQKPVYQPTPEVKPQPRQEYTNYDDDIAEEAQDLEDVDYDYKKKDNIYEVYEEAKRQAFTRPSLEETMDVNNTDIKFGKFKVFEKEQQSNLLEEYVKDFQDPDGLKRAVVMSEILNRKF